MNLGAKLRERRQLAKTALGADGVRPTVSQIEHGLIVVPKPFIDAHRNMPWKTSFRVIFLGKDLGTKRTDQDNRLRLPLKGVLKPGEALRLIVRAGSLHLEKMDGTEDP